jgi:hypothetical protein
MEGASTTASWIQAGGVVAFGCLVLAILLQLKPVLKEFLELIKKVFELLNELRTTLASLLERERMRGERLAARDAQQRFAAVASGVVPAEEFDDPPTNPIAVVPRTKTPPSGVRASTYGPGRPPRGGDG